MKRIFLISSIALGIVFGVITHRSKKEHYTTVYKYLSDSTKKNIKVKNIDSNEIIDTSFSYIKLLGDNKFRVCRYVFLNYRRKNIDSIWRKDCFILPDDTTSYMIIRKIVDRNGINEAMLWAKNKADNIIKQQKSIDTLINH